MKFLQTTLISIIIGLLFFITRVNAQSIPDSISSKIDSLYSKWNNTNGPGCTIGIVRNDSLIYAKGFGLANIEYGIPNGPGTIYHMASISKQFTAAAILLLAQQGKLSLQDDIRKYLPWFPDLKKKITIQHLLNHTSGIRDQWQLLAISGTRLDDVITQEHIIKILSKQKALNFEPGEKYSYSNSGFTMLAEIVKAVSGKTLRQFTDSANFKPLGMNNTHFHDDYTEIEMNRSYSYERKDSAHFSNAVLSYSNAGATSLFTNITDMGKWAMHLADNKPASKEIVDLLTKKTKLNSGKELSYANGIVSDTYRGWRQFAHGGADAGYRTYLTVFPDKKMSFMVFCNLGDMDAGGLAYSMANFFINDTTQQHVEKKSPRDSAAAVLPDQSKWKKYTGAYIGDDGLPFSFDLKNGQLHYTVYSQTNFLIKDAKDTFSFPDDPNIKLVFGIKAKDTTCDIITPDQYFHLAKYTADTSRAQGRIQQYTGTYYCPELDCKYGIVLKDQQLILTNSKYSDAKLNVIGNDHLKNDNWWINHLVMIRDSNKKIIGFDVNSGRIMHLRFNKIE